jgi:hypothetical protein
MVEATAHYLANRFITFIFCKEEFVYRQATAKEGVGLFGQTAFCFDGQATLFQSLEAFGLLGGFRLSATALFFTLSSPKWHLSIFQ